MSNIEIKAQMNKHDPTTILSHLTNRPFDKHKMLTS